MDNSRSASRCGIDTTPTVAVSRQIAPFAPVFRRAAAMGRFSGRLGPRLVRCARVRQSVTDPTMKYADLRDFLAQLERRGELKRVPVEIDPYLEITEICDRVLKSNG